MALVLLPCDLPSWPGVQGLLNTIKTVRTSVQLIELMQRIHTMCCISLDPDENDRIHINHFSGLQRFLDEVMSPDERSNFFHVTLPSMATCALQLRHHKPLDGLQYSLQQQADCTHLEWTFVASLLASAFFSMFPKRTVKTHPTLQDFNLSPMFSHLSSSFQQKKLTNIFRYFDRLATLESSKEWKSRGQMVTTRQVMNKKTMLNMDDWMKCDVPLCPLVIKNDGRIGQTDLNDTYQVCFSNIRLGEDVLNGGERQEDDIFCACPELLSVLVSTEALDYNEAFVVHCSSGNSKTSANEFSHICFLDALDFRLDTSAQYKEWPILRELNKCYVGFLQHPSRTRLPPVGKSFSSEPELPPPSVPTSVEVRHKSTPGQVAAVKALKCFSYKGGFGGGGIVNQAFEDRSSKEESSSRSRLQFDREDSEDSLYKDCKDEVKGKARYSCRRPKAVTKCQKGRKSSRLTMGERREGPLLVLPKTSAPADTSLLEVPESPVASGLEDACSMEASFLSCQSRVSSSTSSSVSLNSEDGYVSCAEEADTTLLLLTDPVCGSKASTAVPESSSSGAIPRHKESFHNIPKFPSQSSRPSSPSSSSSSQSPSEGEPCSRMTDPFGEESELFPLRRSGSTGFILQGEEAAGEEGVEFDEPDLFPGEGGLEQEREWLNQFRRHRHATYTTQTDSRNSSSRYSFSSDFSSDLEDIYEHFEEKMTEGPVRDNPAYAIYGRHLKRTLSDSLTSIPTCRNYNPGDLESSGKHVPISAQLRSLSLTEKMQIQEKLSVECAKRMIRVSSKDAPDAPTLDNQSRTDVDEPVESKPLPESTVENADQSVSVSKEYLSNESSHCIKAVSTGNWGCGHRQGGDPQLKAIIQWMAASKANVPSLIYYTASDARMVKLNIVCRVLLDRHWTVGHVAKAVQRYSDRRRGWPVKVHGDGSGEEADLFNSLLPKETDL